MNEQQNAVIEKVRKLLARADETRNDNEHERAIALRQAHAMLAKHGIEMAQVGDIDATVDYLGALVKGTFALRTKGVWEAGIYDSIAKLNGCKVVRSRKDGKQVVYVFGRKVRAEVIRQMSIYVVDSVIREAKKTGHATSAFGLGAWQGVSAQVDAILANLQHGQMDGEQVSQSTALMIVDQHKAALVESTRIRDEAFPRLRTGRGSRTSNYGAYNAGRSYGNSISLNGQIGRSNARMIGN